MGTVLRRVDASLRAELLALLTASGPEPAACLCTAYHGVKADAERAACRDGLLGPTGSDGYLLHVDGTAVAWCQCAPWTSFRVLAGRPPAVPDAWALTCMVLLPEARGKGLAHVLLQEVIADLRRHRVPHLYAFAHRLGPTYSSPLPELPESVCVAAGMQLARDDPECPLYEAAI